MDVCCTATQVSSCKVTISKPDFYSYILNYDTCQVSADLSQLQNEFPIVSQAFTLAGDFDKTAIDYDGLSDFCMYVYTSFIGFSCNRYAVEISMLLQISQCCYRAVYAVTACFVFVGISPAAKDL